MFTTLVEYDYIIDTISEYNLTESQSKLLLHIITENPTITVNNLTNLIDNISQNKQIIICDREYNLDLILNETIIPNLLDFTIPRIVKYIPKEIIGYLTEVHAKIIVDKILNIEFDENTTSQQLHQRIDEMFTSGDMNIPLQGLRQQPLTMEIVMHGIFAPLLHKGIQFHKKFHDYSKKPSNNKNILKYALKDFSLNANYDELPLLQRLPKCIVVLNNLLGN